MALNGMTLHQLLGIGGDGFEDTPVDDLVQRRKPGLGQILGLPDAGGSRLEAILGTQRMDRGEITPPTMAARAAGGGGGAAGGAAPAGDPREARRKMLMDEAWKMYTGDAPKRPPLKFAWNEIMAASINPKLLPMLFEQKRDTYLDQVESRKSRMSSIRDMLGMMEPDKPIQLSRGDRLVDRTGQVLSPSEPESDGAYTLGPGQQRFDSSGKLISSIPDRAPKPGAGASGFTLGPGQVRYGADGKPIASRPPKPAGGASAGKIPGQQHGRFLKHGINPLEKGDPGYDRYEQLLKASGRGIDPQVQKEARQMYQKAFDDILQRLRVNSEDVSAPPTVAQIAQAETVASKVMEQYLDKFGSAPPDEEDDQEDATLEKRLKELMQQGLTEDQAFDRIYTETRGGG